MSYGEPAAVPDAGRFVALASELVNKHGVVFVSSAGDTDHFRRRLSQY